MQVHHHERDGWLADRKRIGGEMIRFKQEITKLTNVSIRSLRPFADIMRDHVLQPIGMTRRSFEQPISPVNDRNAARGHDGDGKSRGPKWHVYPEQAAGLWRATGKSWELSRRMKTDEVRRHQGNTI